ncbi:TCR/Tet family MFS transporter [Mucilaginibacter pallidiroseus]|uniref:TCR/Tet family MFS transporter n=1 Tax=Mucilaginibacter pallidiroseus TaxID=2599295 RepID=A0A563UJD6_9SPHI|nr:TCR/Tet family MFS transporter [Mucilaginibacter pallidiroseus]TWR31423.1 TCR/Tet family MFS transporter [Mucilaginibacter pallidiroseus]
MTQAAGNHGKAALGFIFVTIFIDVLGLGIIIPITPKLLEQVGHADLSMASQISGYLTFTYASMQFLFAPVLGNLSDRIGRRPVLLFSLFGFGIDYLLMAFAPTLLWLFAGRFIAGIAGASTTTATAYIADVSTGDKRAANFGLIGAATGIGFILGIGLGGFLGAIWIRLPFMVAAGLALLNAVYGFFVLPESLSNENRRNFDWKRANPVGSLLRLRKYSLAVSTLITAYTIVYIGQKAVESTLPFYLLEKFKWTLPSISSLGIFLGLLIAGIQGGLVRWTIPKFGLRKNIMAGIAFYGIGLLLISFNNVGWLMYVYMIPYCLGGLGGTALQGFISEHVGANEQGELQGALTSLVSITTVIGPLIMTSLFHHFTKVGAPVYFPGAPFLMGAILMAIAVVLTIRSFKKKDTDQPDTPAMPSLPKV